VSYLLDLALDQERLQAVRVNYHPGVYAYASWQGLSIEKAAQELREAPETDRNRVKWERVGRFVADMTDAELATLRAQLAEVTAQRDAMRAELQARALKATPT
jgi:hypothetical protein